MTDIDECYLSGLVEMLCDENAECTNIYEGYNCDCHSGFKGDGFKCEG